MSDGFNSHVFTALVIFYLINAVPSAMFGIALARRSGRPWWHGLLPAFVVPWLGLLFLGGQPMGKPYVTGPARYSMVMLFVAGVLVFVSIWHPWVSGDGTAFGRPGHFEYSPNEVLPVAIAVWVLAIGLILSAVGLLFRGGFTVAIGAGVLVSVIGGIIAAVSYLFGPAGLFLAEVRDQHRNLDVVVGPGGWIALVALCSAYLAIVVVAFGLKTHPLAPPVPPQPMSVPQQPGQQWQPAQPAPSAAPQRPGATW